MSTPKRPLKDALIEKIKRAENALELAGSELDDLLRTVDVAPRAEKTIVSEVVGDAFAKLRAAKMSLRELERELGGGQTTPGTPKKSGD